MGGRSLEAKNVTEIKVWRVPGDLRASDAKNAFALFLLGCKHIHTYYVRSFGRQAVAAAVMVVSVFRQVLLLGSREQGNGADVCKHNDRRAHTQSRKTENVVINYSVRLVINTHTYAYILYV